MYVIGQIRYGYNWIGWERMTGGTKSDRFSNIWYYKISSCTSSIKDLYGNMDKKRLFTEFV